MKFRRVTENADLIPSILAALAHYPDVFAFQVKAEAKRGKRSIVPKGTADILGVKNAGRLRRQVPGSALLSVEYTVGQAFAIETKLSHRVTCLCLSCKAQRLWRFQWEKRGGLYVLARSPQEAIDGLLGRRAA
jgi:hypothetical protein